MPGDYGRQQRLAMWIAGIIAVIVLAIAIPILVSSSFRLSVGQRLGIAPGANADKLYGPDDDAELVILQQTVPVAGTASYTRFFAVAIAVHENGVIVTTNLATHRQARLPLTNYDLIATSRDRSWLLFVDKQPDGSQHAVLWSLTSNEVKPLLAGHVTPDIPGDWAHDVGGAAIDCNGVSPHDTWVACLTSRSANRKFFFGDWQLQVSPFGNPHDSTPLYRGNGIEPIVGWSSDERFLYFQNELGIWRVAAPKPPAASALASPTAVSSDAAQPA